MGAEQICRLPGRTEARPYDRMVFSVMYYVENKQGRVAACCDPTMGAEQICRLPGPSEARPYDRSVLCR